MRLATPLVLAVALVLPVAALSAGRAAPKPCRLVSTATASKYLHAQAKAYPERANDGGTICLFIAGQKRLQVDDGPKSLASTPNPADDPPGTVIKKEPRFGSEGYLVYNTRRKYRFANVGFVKGSYEYDVYSQAIPKTGILAIARLVFHKAP